MTPPPKKKKANQAGAADFAVNLFRKLLGIDDPDAAVNTPETAAVLPTIYAQPSAAAKDLHFQPNVLTQEIANVLSGPFAQDTLRALFNVRPTFGAHLSEEPGTMAFVDTEAPTRIQFPQFGLRNMRSSPEIGATLIHELTHSEQYAKTGKPEFKKFQQEIQDLYLNRLQETVDTGKEIPNAPQWTSADEMMGYAMQAALGALRGGMDPSNLEYEFPGTIAAHKYITTVLGQKPKKKLSRR